MTETIAVQYIECQKQSSRQERRICWSLVPNLQTDPTNEEQKCCHCPEAERISFTTRNKAVSVQVLLNRLIERGCYGFLRDGREVCGERLFQGFWTEMEGSKWKVRFSKTDKSSFILVEHVFAFSHSDKLKPCISSLLHC